MIFQSLTGKTPFRGGSEYLTFQAIIEGDLNLPSELSPEALEKQARRIALINERETVWDLTTDGIGVEIKGRNIILELYIKFILIIDISNEYKYRDQW